MALKITWIRHGQSEWNAIGRWQGHTDTDLSPFGRSQASLLGRRLAGKHFDHVYSSDLRRALDTAKLALPDSQIRIEPRLREINFGVFEGKTSEDLTELERDNVKLWWGNPYAEKLQGGESMACVNLRIASWIEELPDNCHIAVFCHGGVIRNAVWQVVGLPHNGNWRLSIDNTSMTIIEYGQESQIIERINDSAHLEDSG